MREVRLRSDTNIQWNAVALWAWDIVVDNCAICRNHIMDLCKIRCAHRRFHFGTFLMFHYRYRVSSEPGFGHK